jgi:hypothetical protein
MFSVEERERVRSELLARAEADPKITAAAISGACLGRERAPTHRPGARPTAAANAARPHRFRPTVLIFSAS